MGKLNSIEEKALRHFGEQSQVLKTIEECSELIQALSKYARSPEHADMENIREEIADVEIMITQMRFLFDSELVDHIKGVKLSKLEDRFL